MCHFSFILICIHKCNFYPTFFTGYNINVNNQINQNKNFNKKIKNLHYNMFRQLLIN